MKRVLSVFLISLIVFILTTPHHVTLEDSGIFLLSGNKWGIAHPPGYPLYTIICNLINLIPLSSIVLRTHFVSILFASLSTSLLLLILDQLSCKKQLSHIFWSLCFAFSRKFWSQAIIAEVYTLNTFLCLLLLFLTLRFTHPSENSKTDRSFFPLIGFITGLALSHHWPLAVLFYPTLLILLTKRKHFINTKSILRYILGVLVGLLPYIYIFVRSAQNPLISFYGPLTTIRDLIFFILRLGYTDNKITSASFEQVLHINLSLLNDFNLQYVPYLGLFLLTLGLVPKFYKDKYIYLSLTFMLISNSFLLRLIVIHPDDYFNQSVFSVYPLTSYAAYLLCVAFAGQNLVTFITPKIKQQTVQKWINISTFSFIFLILTFFHNLNFNNRKNYNWAHNYGMLILNSLPPNINYFTYDDIDTGVLGHLHYNEGVRKDIGLYNTQSLIFNNRIFNPLKETKKAIKNHKLSVFIKKSQKKIFYSKLIDHDYATNTYGPYKEINKNAQKGELNIIYKRKFNSFLTYALKTSSTSQDPWTITHANTTIASLSGHMYQIYKNTKNENLKKEIWPALEKSKKHFYGILGIVDKLKGSLPTDYAINLIKSGFNLSQSYPYITKRDLATLHYNYSFFLFKKKQNERGLYHMQKSVAINPDKKNPALKTLADLYKIQNNQSALSNLLKKYPYLKLN